MSIKVPPADNDTMALEISALRFDYAGKLALDNVNLSIARGELVILLGPNGAGKTTLFSLICGLFSPAHGAIAINGKSLHNRAEALAPLGIVFQAQTLDLDLTVQQNLTYFCDLHGLPRDTARSRIEDALQRMNLHQRANDKVRILNGGHRRRVEIIRATLHQPSILLLDEPTVGLDIPTRAELLDYVRALPAAQGCAVLWATHLIDEIHDTDRVALLHAGKLHHDGIARQLLQDNCAADLPALMKSLTMPVQQGHIVDESATTKEPVT